MRDLFVELCLTVPVPTDLSNALSRVHEGCALDLPVWTDGAGQREHFAPEKSLFLVHDVLTSDCHFFPKLHFFHNSIFTLGFLSDASTESREI